MLSKKESCFFLRYIYASKESVFTLLNEYLYQIIAVNNEKFKSILKKLYFVELNHLEQIGKLIKECGELPSFLIMDCNTEYYWNSYSLYYDKEIDVMIEIDIEFLEKNIFALKRLASVPNCEKTNKVIKSILLEEESSLNELKKYYMEANEEKT